MVGRGRMIAGAGAMTVAGTSRVVTTAVAAAATTVIAVALGEAGHPREGAANAATRPTIVNAGGRDGIRRGGGREREGWEREREGEVVK